MDAQRRKKLEAAGFRFGDAEDFLELTDEERGLVELRLAVSRAVRRLREEQKLTQQQLAARLKTSQPRVARIEMGTSDVSLDLLFRGLFAVGGKLRDIFNDPPKPTGKAAGRTPAPVKAVRRPKTASTRGVPVEA